MKVTNALIMPFLLLTSAFANDPASIPWPVGSTPAMMNSTKTLMNSYGDPQNAWGDGFHCGVDFDVWTEPPLGTTLVWCVHGETGSPVVISRRLQDYWRGYYEWTVITTEGTDSLNHEDFGWCYEHLTNPVYLVTPENSDDGVPGWQTWEEINVGEQIASMNPDVETQHTHFKWTTWNFDDWCYVNPPDYLTPSASGSNYTWTFNPSGYTPAFELFFGEQRIPEAWPASPTLVLEDPDFLKDENNLSGSVDVFLGYGLSGVGQTTMPECGRNDLAAERIFWKIRKDTVSGFQDVISKWLVNFDCPLTYQDTETCKLLYFKWDLDQLNNIFTYIPDGLDHEGLIVCLTNCGDDEGWDNLGIENIEENWWQTDAVLDGTEVTINPTLAAFPDGTYQLEATLYPHDSNVSETYDVSCELHNFHPALREVTVTNSVTVDTYYHAIWIPDGTGFETELYVPLNTSVPAGTVVEITLGFTEEINTSSISADLGPLSITNGSWSGTVVDNDTWTGEVTMPSAGSDGFYVLSVSASDVDDNSLMDPEGAGSVPGSPAPDTHHVISLGFGVDLDWSVTLPNHINGSVAIADIDGDGYMELAVQTEEGTVHVYNHDGTIASGWPRSDTGYSSSYDDVHITPALGDINNDGNIDVIAGYECGSMAWTGSTGNPLTGWPFKVNGVEDEGQDFAYSSPVLCNLDSDVELEAIVCRQLYQLPPDGPPESVFALDSDGSQMWSCNLNPANDGESVMSTPVVVDVTGDETPEILVCSSTSPLIGKSTEDGPYCNGRMYLLSGSTGAIISTTAFLGDYVYSSPVVGDVDSDGALEAIVSSFFYPGHTPFTYVFSLPGLTAEHSWSLSASNYGSKASAAIGDIDNNGSLDVVVAGYNKIFAWNGITKQALPGFSTPVNTGASIRHGLSLSDIDGDGYQEIMYCMQDGSLSALNHDGTTCGGFPIKFGTNSFSQPAIDDIDGDGKLEICVTCAETGILAVYQAGESSWPTLMSWPQFQHDVRNSGILYADFEAPAPPAEFTGDGELVGNIFTVDLEWTLSINDPYYEPLPSPPADVISYNIYRKIPPRPVELVATLPAGTSEYTDVIVFSSLPTVVAYYASAWDGVNESDFTPVIKIIPGSLNNIASGCPVREIYHSAGVGTSQSLTAVGSSLSDVRRRNNCRVLTDGDYDEFYYPSGSANCVEIDLGDVFTITDAVVFSGNLSQSESVVDDSSVLISESPFERAVFELSVDGRTFSRTDSGNARYIRVYGAAGATEIEVYGEASSATSALVEIRRNESEGYRIASVEGAILTVTVFDLTGRTVWNSTSSSGEVLWNRCNSSGNTVPSGIYLLMVESEDMDTFTAKVVVR